MLTGIHTLICEVEDMQRAVDFYQGVLGAQVETSSPHWSSLTLGTSRLGLHPPFTKGAPRGGGWIVGVQTSDLQSLRNALEASGHECGPYHDTPTGVVMDFTDPDGNRLQAIQLGIKAAALA